MEQATPTFTPIPEPIWTRAEADQRRREFKGRVFDTSVPTTLVKVDGSWKIALNRRT